MMILRRPSIWIALAVTAAFALAPGWGANVSLRETLLLGAVYVVLASNLNLMIGLTGYVNFGSTVFFGLGGYIGMYLITSLDWSVWVASLVGGICVSLIALLLGLGVLRLRGAYFALATLGINEAVKAFVANFQPFGGASGMYLSFSSFAPLGGPRHALWLIYFAIIALVGLSLILGLVIKNSKFGLGLLAIREDEDAAGVLGVNTSLYKSMIYAVSAFLPAMMGTLFFFKNGVILPDQAFDLALSIEVIVMLMIGGRGTVFGAALGAFLYAQMRGMLVTSATFSQFQLVVAGGLLLAVVLFLPGGFMGWLYKIFPKLRKVLE